MPAEPPARKQGRPPAAPAVSSDEEQRSRERRGLELFLRQTHEFRLALALYHDVLERDAAIRSLTGTMAGHGLRVLTLDLREAAPGRSLLELVQSLALTAAGERVAVMVVNLETRVDYAPELSTGAGPGVALWKPPICTASFFPLPARARSSSG